VVLDVVSDIFFGMFFSTLFSTTMAKEWIAIVASRSPEPSERWQSTTTTPLFLSFVSEVKYLCLFSLLVLQACPHSKSPTPFRHC
jgi:hypothetical protein